MNMVKHARDEAEKLGLEPEAHWALVAWRTGFACYMMLADPETDEPQDIVKFEPEKS